MVPSCSCARLKIGSSLKGLWNSLTFTLRCLGYVYLLSEFLKSSSTQNFGPDGEVMFLNSDIWPLFLLLPALLSLEPKGLFHFSFQSGEILSYIISSFFLFLELLSKALESKSTGLDSQEVKESFIMSKSLFFFKAWLSRLLSHYRLKTTAFQLRVNDDFCIFVCAYPLFPRAINCKGLRNLGK